MFTHTHAHSLTHIHTHTHASLSRDAEHGKIIPTLDQLPLFSDEPIDLGRHTIAYESRFLKELFQRVLRG